MRVKSSGRPRRTEVVAHRQMRVWRALAEQLDRVSTPNLTGSGERNAHEGRDNWRAALPWALSDRGDVVLGQRLVG